MCNLIVAIVAIFDGVIRKEMRQIDEECKQRDAKDTDFRTGIRIKDLDLRNKKKSLEQPPSLFTILILQNHQIAPPLKFYTLELSLFRSDENFF